MSRHGYVEDGDYDQWSSIMWSGRVKSALRGKRGQKALMDMIRAMHAMPKGERELQTGGFRRECGVCALGALAQARGVDLSQFEPSNADDHPDYVDEIDADAVGASLDIAPSMVREVMWQNDSTAAPKQWGPHANEEPPGAGLQRWQWIRRWARDQLTPENQAIIDAEGEEIARRERAEAAP